MTIFEATHFSEEYFEAAVRLIVQLSSNARPMERQHFNGLLSSENSHLFFVRYEGVVVGMATLGFYDIPTGRRGWIEDVAVDENYRSRGFGRALVANALCFAKASGADTVMLTSNPARIAANRLYQSMGFSLKNTNTYVYKF